MILSCHSSHPTQATDVTLGINDQLLGTRMGALGGNHSIHAFLVHQSQPSTPTTRQKFIHNNRNQKDIDKEVISSQRAKINMNNSRCSPVILQKAWGLDKSTQADYNSCQILYLTPVSHLTCYIKLFGVCHIFCLIPVVSLLAHSSLCCMFSFLTCGQSIFIP